MWAEWKLGFVVLSRPIDDLQKANNCAASFLIVFKYVFSSLAKLQQYSTTIFANSNNTGVYGMRYIIMQNDD